MSETEFEFELGDVVENVYTGTQGTVTCIADHLTGCTRVAVRPNGHDPTQHHDDDFYYEGELALTQSIHQRNLHESRVPDSITEVDIETGNIVRDNVTGIEGIVGVISYEFFNCPRVGVFPSVGDIDDDRYDNDAEWFDLPRVEYVDDGVADEYSDLNDTDNEGETGPIGTDLGKKSNPLR